MSVEKKNRIIGNNLKEAVKKRMPKLLENVPGGKLVEEAVEIGRETVEATNADLQAVHEEPGEYMDHVIFKCRKSRVIGDEDEKVIRAVLRQEYPGRKERDQANLDIINDFIYEYIGEAYIQDDASERCTFQKNQIQIDFEPGVDFAYDEEAMCRVMEAFDALFVEGLFGELAIGGYDYEQVEDY